MDHPVFDQGEAMTGNDEWSMKASAVVRHSIPANTIPQVCKNNLVDRIADAMANAYALGRQDAATALENWLVKFTANLQKAKVDLGDE